MNKEQRSILGKLMVRIQTHSDELNDIQTPDPELPAETLEVRLAKCLKIVDKIIDIQTELDDVAADEQEKYDNLPPTFQDGSRGETFQEIVAALEDASAEISNGIEDFKGKITNNEDLDATIEQAIQYLDSAIEGIDSAVCT